MNAVLHGARHATLVEVTRGEHVESVHTGSVAVVDAAGRLLHYVGDPECLTFTRSTIKPFQAAPFVGSGGARRFGFNSQEIALLCASHSGEAMHVKTVRSMLAKAGCVESQLACGCHLPLRYTLDALPQTGEVYTQVHNNCSGKHAGFLAYCVQHCLPLTGYLAPAHALQRAVRRSVAAYGGMDESDLKAGTDGCSAPNYAMPLSRLARAYARLAEGGSDMTRDESADPTGRSVTAILRDAMMAHPDLVSGTGRSDLAFMRSAPGDWVAKIGADGVQAIGSRRAGIGIAIKIADGSTRALPTTAIAVLQQLGLLPETAGSPLASWERPQIKTHTGLHTGEMRSVVRLLGKC
ncbi:MAG: asparaginase [Burkholderiaceae bacterium]